MKATPHQQFSFLALALIAMLVFAACRPADNLDITPTPTPMPEPTATPTPTPLPAGFVEKGNPNEEVMEALLDLLPKTFPAGEEEWKLDYTRGEDGIEKIRGVRGTAVGKKVHFRTQEGGLMSLNFAVFDTTEEATANYERILGIRSVLENGEPNEDFPLPNVFGAGLYGSVSIFQIDNYFIEVFIELFTRGSPLIPLSRQTMRFFEENRSAFEAAVSETSSDAGSVDVLELVLESLPSQIVTTTQWQRDLSRFDNGVDTPRNIEKGRAIRVAYIDQMANNFQMTFGQFDSPADALAHYEKIKDIREGIEDENSIEDLPQPHVLGRGLYGSVAIFAIDEFFIEVLMERAPGTSANPTEAIARRALAILEVARQG